LFECLIIRLSSNGACIENGLSIETIMNRAKLVISVAGTNLDVKRMEKMNYYRRPNPHHQNLQTCLLLLVFGEFVPPAQDPPLLESKMPWARIPKLAAALR
jgi:hypothetical protein